MKNTLPAIIIDLDGTLANIDERRNQLWKTNDWGGFRKGIERDKLNFWCKEIIEKFKVEYKIVLLTGRDSSCLKDTENWLEDNNIHWDELHCRKLDDYRKDAVVKEEIYTQLLKDKYEILFVVDDRQSVVDMWRSLKLICLQCDYGNF